MPLRIDWPPPYRLVKPDVTFDAYLELCDEDTKAGLISGEIIVHSPASNVHEDLFRFLLRLIDGYVEVRDCGIVRGSRFPLHLSDLDAPEPDLLFVSNASRSKISKKSVEGAPELVIEIVSPSTRRYDLGVKKDLYLQAGVVEYWAIDPDEKTLYVYKPKIEPRILTRGRLNASVPEGFWMDVNWLWTDPLPKVAPLVQKILETAV